MTLRLATLVYGIALAQLAGCAGSGRKPYPDESAVKNLSVRSATSTASAFTSVRAELDVYSVDPQCRPQYLGTVELGQPSVAIGIPRDRWSYLVFEFMSSGFLGGTQGRISRATLLRPRADHHYEIDASYRDDIYDVVLREKPPRGVPRELPLLDLASCRPAGAS